MDETNNTAELILEAAVELFAERGYHATSMREIAAAVNVQAAGIYYWYPNKEAILVELQRSFLSRLTTEVTSAIDRHKKPAPRLAAAVREHVIFHGIHSRAAFVTDSEIRALSPGSRREVVALRDAYEDLFAGLIQDGVDAGVFATSDVRIATYAILLECTGVAIWYDPSGDQSLDEIADIHVDLVLKSVGATKRSAAAAARQARAC